MKPSRFTPSHFGILAILFASILFGTTGTVASFAPNISALAIGAFAMGMGGVFQACLSIKPLKNDFEKILQHKNTLIISVVALAIYPLAFYSSMRLAGVAIGTVISISTAPFFSALLECLCQREKKISQAWLLSFVIGVVGIVLLITSKSSTDIELDPDLKLLGVVLGFVAALTYAVYSWGAKRLIDAGIQSQAAMGGIFGLGAMILLPTLFITGDNLFASSTNIMVIVYMALIPMGLGYIAFGFGLRFVTASSANLITLFEPVIAAILAVIVVGEAISLIGWIGIALILICLLLQTKVAQA